MMQHGSARLMSPYTSCYNTVDQIKSTVPCTATCVNLKQPLNILGKQGVPGNPTTAYFKSTPGTDKVGRCPINQCCNAGHEACTSCWASTHGIVCCCRRDPFSQQLFCNISHASKVTGPGHRHLASAG
eukprot:GHRQ01020284.1.p1 GENE.GHRQ01020284.1~~GHRQ01020284.1.p1  ORF type:complete len:128 (+),score=16.47 GHRQ01020284.1:42-425(+)